MVCAKPEYFQVMLGHCGAKLIYTISESLTLTSSDTSQIVTSRQWMNIKETETESASVSVMICQS